MVSLLIVCGFVCVLILMDVLSGFIAAVQNGDVSSSVMREGIFHKLAELLLMALALLVEYMLEYPPFDSIGIPTEIVFLVVAYLAVMEIISVIENICKINPSLPIAKIMRIFNINEKGVEEEEFPFYN